MTDTQPLLRVRNLTKVFAVGRGPSTVGGVRAVDGVSFEIGPGETLAVIGESGCGKTTTARLALRLQAPTSGSIEFMGRDISRLSHSEMKPIRRNLQVIFQDPMASLSPRRRVEDIIAEPLWVQGLVKTRQEAREHVAALLEEVGLSPELASNYPRQFSGGQRQRIGIARALALRPKLIIADEPVSALDVSVQAQVINLLANLQKKHGIAFLFIAHDLAILRHIAHRTAVMYLGRIVEEGPTEDVFSSPCHPYTQALLSSAPDPDPDARHDVIVLEGDPPSPVNLPSGCRFHPRCPIAADICREVSPADQTVTAGHVAACHFAKPFPIKR